MALRNIIEEGDPILKKHCRPVVKFDERLHTLLDDMEQTLRESDGVGLAAPQVGILRRAVLVLETNVPKGEEEKVIELINPVITFSEGREGGPEGCLSVPGVFGFVYRPTHIVVEAQDRYGQPFKLEARDLTARAVCHEMAHLEGELFTDIADHIMDDKELEKYYGKEAVQQRKRPKILMGQR